MIQKRGLRLLEIPSVSRENFQRFQIPGWQNIEELINRDILKSGISRYRKKRN
jgi:hypothetical protein